MEWVDCRWERRAAWVAWGRDVVVGWVRFDGVGIAIVGAIFLLLLCGWWRDCGEIISRMGVVVDNGKQEWLFTEQPVEWGRQRSIKRLEM